MQRLNKVICAIIGHDWQVVDQVPAPESLPGGVPVERLRCRRCGEVVLRAVLGPGQAAVFGAGENAGGGKPGKAL